MGKAPIEKINKTIKEVFLNQINEVYDSRLPEGTIDIYYMYMNCINLYREIKNDLFQTLFENRKQDSNYSELLIGSTEVFI